MRFRTYSELKNIESFEDRFKYLSLKGTVGETTFGFDRWINQQFYTSREWRDVRDIVLIRDEGCDLGHSGLYIHHRPTIHHMNPMTFKDLENEDPKILDPEYLITVSHRTHNAIHYGDERLLPQPLVERRPGDTKLW